MSGKKNNMITEEPLEVVNEITIEALAEELSVIRQKENNNRVERDNPTYERLEQLWRKYGKVNSFEFGTDRYLALQDGEWMVFIKEGARYVHDDYAANSVAHLIK